MSNNQINLTVHSDNFLNNVLKRGANNFDILRLIAALAVIVGHGYAIAPQPPLQDGVLSILHFDYSGSLAVKFFFFLSGLLVTNSIISKPEALSFFIKRAFRIFPGLLVCLMIAVFIVGPLFTAFSLSQYFSLRETWTYIPKNIFLTDMQWRLSGVFTNSKFGLNGSLWTLPYEILCYIYLAIFYGLGLLKNKNIANVFFSSVVAFSFIAPSYLPAFFSQNPDALLLPACFAIGGLFANNKAIIRINIGSFILLWLLSIVLKNSILFQFLFYIAFFYSCIFIASLNFVINRFKIPFDASYGVYVYGFMFQQCVYYLLPAIGVHGNQIITSILALTAGILSWYFIEKPFINIGHRVAKYNVSDILKIKLSIFSKQNFLNSNNEKRSFASNNIITFLLFTTVALIIHAIVLRFFFPGYYSPLYPQHSDFYMPAALANIPELTYTNLLSWPRSMNLIFAKLIGNFGIKGSIASVILLVCINVGLGALLIKRILNINLSALLLVSFVVYCYLVFSQPYFYIFYAQDIGAQLSYFFLLLGAYLFYSTVTMRFFLAGTLLLICCVLAFLSKETYGLSALIFSFLWFIYYRKVSFLKSWVPFFIIISSLVIVFIINFLIKSTFVDLNASAGNPYKISLNPLIIIIEWLKYLKESLNFAIAGIILFIAYCLLKYKKQNKSELIFIAIACLLGTFASWLPNAILPNHHYKGYSFNGAYLLYLPLLTIPIFATSSKMKQYILLVVIGLCIGSHFFNVPKYKDNNWVIIQENTQRNLLRELEPLINNIKPGSSPVKILIQGITFPFHPFAFPQSLRVFKNAEYANFDVVNYMTDVTNGPRKDLVKFIDSSAATLIQYDQIWTFQNDGNLVKKPDNFDDLLKGKIILASSTNKNLKIGQENFSKFISKGFYNNENGIRWTNGNAIIVLDSTITNTDSIVFKLNTYMPPKCIKIVPHLFFIDNNNKSHETKLTGKKDNMFYYSILSNKKDSFQAINITSELIDASPDQRLLSFPFINLEVSH